MEFVIVISFIVLIAIVIGRTANSSEVIPDKKCLYDQDTVKIMRTYKLINDDEYRLMLADLKKKEIIK